MKDTSINGGLVYFLNFSFNIKMRSLTKDEEVYQLRKKEADVLALLCRKYPQPVSQDDFLTEVWQGGYVTSQSIAQVIRSLRRILEDKNKNIITTIPKLGYQLATPPSFSTPEVNIYEVEQENIFWKNGSPEVLDDNKHAIAESKFSFLYEPSFASRFLSKKGFFPKKIFMLFTCGIVIFMAVLIFRGSKMREIPLILNEERAHVRKDFIWNENYFYNDKDDLLFCNKKEKNVTCSSGEEHSTYTWNNY
ncbi:winged helix-turn-helix domain-containing protein [Pectobacterium parvum]|nr:MULTISPECIES: winged helix-turn-helix domain-containing protein [Pectobacterium]UFK38947.1 winged helix-turn-helix domain-containing protein [Pectobacterium parvum]UVD97068.1 winged helix-turn-helix domain-containing protein [Pectobacterium parvum]GKW40821.1 reguatory protein [Pectobacterium carotovorum subsp. carotovorum]